MGLFSGGRIIGRILASEIWRAYFRESLLLLLSFIFFIISLLFYFLYYLLRQAEAGETCYHLTG